MDSSGILLQIISTSVRSMDADFLFGLALFQALFLEQWKGVASTIHHDDFGDLKSTKSIFHQKCPKHVLNPHLQYFTSTSGMFF